MTSAECSYAVVTPVRDDAENLKRLAASMTAQTLLPDAWVIVDNGSADETPAVARALAAEHAWIEIEKAPPAAHAVPGAPIVRAFHVGLRRLGERGDVVVKLDADVSMGADHFERLLAAFDADPALGIAGSECWELEDGEWTRVQVTNSHVRGAVRAYRRACLDQLLPLPERTGWDTIDELQAQVRGWRTEVVPSLAFRHHRAVGARDGSARRRWQAKGSAAYYLGYRPLYLVLRAVYNARSGPAALAMISGYAAAALRREPRHPDRDARAVLRRQQRLRSLRERARELRPSS